MPRALVGLILVGGLAACAPSPEAQERAARMLVFDRLSQKDVAVVVGPVVMQSRFAIVDWTRGRASGGRTLLRRDGDGWVMALCGGAPMKQRPTLIKAGVPDGTAGVLATKLLREESRLTDDRRVQIERWRGVRTDGVAVACPEPKAG